MLSALVCKEPETVSLRDESRCVHRKDCRCPRAPFQRDFATSHRPSGVKRSCSTHPPIAAATRRSLGSRRSLLSLLSLCSSEAGQPKSIVGLCPQLPGTVYSFYTQRFSKDKTSFQVQELRKNKPPNKQWKSQFNLRKQKTVSL